MQNIQLNSKLSKLEELSKLLNHRGDTNMPNPVGIRLVKAVSILQGALFLHFLLTDIYKGLRITNEKKRKSFIDSL